MPMYELHVNHVQVHIRIARVQSAKDQRLVAQFNGNLTADQRMHQARLKRLKKLSIIYVGKENHIIRRDFRASSVEAMTSSAKWHCTDQHYEPRYISHL